MKLRSDLERDKDPRAHILNELEADETPKMKRPVKKHICEEIYDNTDYVVTVGFAGYLAVDKSYHVTADSEDEAIELALEEARDDLYVDNVNETDEDVYEVEINFGGFRGADQTYEEFANDEDDAVDMALNDAYDDLTVQDIERIGLDESCSRRRRHVFKGTRRG